MRSSVIGLLLVGGVCLSGCRSSAIVAAESQAASTPEALARTLIDALDRGDLEQVQQLFIPEDEFMATFDLPEAEARWRYEKSRREFVESLTETAPYVKGARYRGLDLHHMAEPVLMPVGSDFRLAHLKEATWTLEGVRVIVGVSGGEQKIKLDAIIKPGSSWRLINPVVYMGPRVSS